MSENDIYCGAAVIVPKNKRRGSMKECYNKNQVRYWGIKRIDNSLLNSTSKKKRKSNTKDKLIRMKLLEKVATIDGKAKKLKRKIEFTKHPTKTQLKEFRKEADKLKKERNEIIHKLKKIDKQIKKNKSKS